MKRLLLSNLILISIATATTLKVPSQYSTIQTAIDASSNGDTVLVAAGTYTEKVLIDGKNISLISENGRDSTIIDALDRVNWRPLTVLNITDSIKIQGFTLTNGNRSSGTDAFSGGLYVEGSKGITLNNLIVDNNTTAGSGGGIGINSCTYPVTLDSIIISNNRSSDHGGGLQVIYTDSIDVSNLIVTNNFAPFGGGVQIGNSKANLTGLEVLFNESDMSGGGVYFNYSNSNLVNVIISNNSATGKNFDSGGGGIYCTSSDINLKGVVITNNSAYRGGGIDIFNESSVLISNGTIANNSASDNGGGIYTTSSSLSLVNCILWNDSPNEIDGTASVTYSDVQNGWAGAGNIDLNPLFEDLEGNDYHLKIESPCIGAGKSIESSETDINGNPRPNPAGSRPDLGAYENSSPGPAPSPFDLFYPFEDTTIVLSRESFLDTLFFAWDQSVDADGDEVTYRRELTGDLPEYIRFIVESNEQTTTNMYKVPYHHIEDYMHEAGVELISGTWTIVATDGTYDTYPANGPFSLTIDGSQLNIADSDIIPETFALYANYPNPFNPTTTISYDLPKQAQVTLGIYDILGKQIKTLVNQSQDAGSKTAVWDGTNNSGRPVSAGVYLYRIKAGEFSQTRKMVLLR